MRLRGEAVATRAYFRVYGHTPRAVRLFGRFARHRVKKIAGGPPAVPWERGQPDVLLEFSGLAREEAAFRAWPDPNS